MGGEREGQGCCQQHPGGHGGKGACILTTLTYQIMCSTAAADVHGAAPAA